LVSTTVHGRAEQAVTVHSSAVAAPPDGSVCVFVVLCVRYVFEVLAMVAGLDAVLASWSRADPFDRHKDVNLFAAFDYYGRMRQSVATRSERSTTLTGTSAHGELATLHRA
jgi:hypothetical protein